MEGAAIWSGRGQRLGAAMRTRREAVEHRSPRRCAGQFGSAGVVGARDEGPIRHHALRELGERALETLEVLVVGVEVVAVHIGHHGGRRRQMQKRSVALVRFGDQMRPGATAGVAAVFRHHAADHERGIQASGVEDARHHAGGGRLAVAAGHRDAAPRAHQFGQHQAPGNHRNVQLPRARPLDVVGADGAGGDDQFRIRHGIRVVADAHWHAEARETLRGRRAETVRTAHSVAFAGKDFGEAAHSGAADADAVDAPRRIESCDFWFSHRPPPARPPPSAVGCSTAGLASPRSASARRAPPAPNRRSNCCRRS